MAEPESVGAIADEIKQPEPEAPPDPEATAQPPEEISWRTDYPTCYLDEEEKAIILLHFREDEDPTETVRELRAAGLHVPYIPFVAGESKEACEPTLKVFHARGHVAESMCWQGYLTHRPEPLKGESANEV